MPAILPDPNQTPLPQPLPTPGWSGTAGGSGNPVLDEIDQAHAGLSPHAKLALAQAYPASPLPQGQPAQPAQPTGQPKPIAPLATSPRPAPLPSTTLQNEGSGISQIHSAWGRVPLQIADAVGTAIAPRLTAMLPGTELHHQALVNEQRGNEAHEQAADLNQAKLGQEGALTNETNVRADVLQHPPDEAGREALQGAQTDEAKAKAESLRNPPEKQTAVQHVQDDQGNYWLLHPDGTAQQVKGPGGQQLKGKQAVEKTASPEQQYLDEYKQQHPGSTIAEAERGFKSIEPPQRAPQIMMMMPNPDGTRTAQVVRPGTTTGAGAVTPAEMSSENKPVQATAATRHMAEIAPRVLELSARVGQLVDEQTKSLGPAASRWAEFMAGKVGAPNGEFTKLRTNVGLLQTALMNMHVGSKGGEQMMEHFKDLIDTSKQSPENLKAALGEIQSYAKEVAKEGQGNKGGGPSGQQSGPKAGDVDGGYRFKGGNPSDKNSWEKVQ